jgi:hypothetical protein
MGLVKQATRRLSPVDYLQNLEKPVQRVEKRKRGTGAVGESSKRRSKKIKLN